jgi:hypothetical protein
MGQVGGVSTGQAPRLLWMKYVCKIPAVRWEPSRGATTDWTVTVAIGLPVHYLGVPIPMAVAARPRLPRIRPS